jgi:alpha-N-acetylglucosamine transferase
MNAYVTLITNDHYILGALALARSLKLTGSSYKLIVMATFEHGEYFEDLEREGCIIHPVKEFDFSEEFKARHERNNLHKRDPFTRGGKPGFHNPLENFCKLRLWEMEEYDKLVYLDADVIVTQNIDILFSYPSFAGAPNLYNSMEDMQRLNSGVFVAEPGKKLLDHMLLTLDSPGKFWRRTDQTFLETYFEHWHGLPYIFNTLQYIYFNMPELWNWKQIKVVHYQYEKPWDPDNPKKDILGPVIDLWWSCLDKRPLPKECPALLPNA